MTSIPHLEGKPQKASRYWARGQTVIFLMWLASCAWAGAQIVPAKPYTAGFAGAIVGMFPLLVMAHVAKGYGKRFACEMAVFVAMFAIIVLIRLAARG